jgi:signal transduction histidine kinase
MRWSIRWQLLFPQVLLILAIAATTAYACFATARRVRHEIEGEVRNVALLFNEASFNLNHRTLGWMKRLSGADYHLVDVRELVPSDSSQPPSTFTTEVPQLPEEPTLAQDWQTLQLGQPIVVGGRSYLCSGIRLRTGSTLYVFYPEQQLNDAMFDAMRPPLVLGLAVLFAAGLALRVAQRLGQRIRELESSTRRIAHGDFSPAPLSPHDDELRDLGRSVNEMASRLAHLEDRTRQGERMRLIGQLSAGLAHQVRNGVAGAQLAVQLHARACQGPADVEALQVALRQLALVEANLKRFLDLGRTTRLVRRPCDLVALIEDAIGLLRPRCRHTNIDLRWRPPEGPVAISGDALRLGHLVLNLLTNAVEAAGPDGWVEVVCRRDSGGTPAPVVIEVRDSGPGPGADVAGKLFQPFVTGKTEGIGLGLTVARDVAIAHGGTAEWQANERPTCFRVVLPVEEAPTRVAARVV